MKKVISFCIYGDKYKYTIGLIKNIEIINSKYPDWEIYIYYSNVPSFFINILKKMKNCKIQNCIHKGFKWEGMFWRFYPIESNVDIMLSRDADSRITEREMNLVNQWIDSDKTFHIIRDNMSHRIEILGGTWGCKVKQFQERYKIKKINEYLNIYYKRFTKNIERQPDQYFLKENIYPLIKNDNMSHISFEFLRYSKEDIIINKCEENFIGKDIDFTREEIEKFVNEYQKKL
jgi:hypothetical protein